MYVAGREFPPAISDGGNSSALDAIIKINSIYMYYLLYEWRRKVLLRPEKPGLFCRRREENRESRALAQLTVDGDPTVVLFNETM